MNPFDLANKTILVTGASRGIGQGIAIYLSRLGARIVAVARDEKLLAETVSRLKGSGHLAISCDLSEVEKLPVWMKDVVAQTGPLYGLVHSAGIAPLRPLNVLSFRTMTEMNRINFEAAVMLSKGFRQGGVYEKTGSSIVYLCSVAALKGDPGLAGYAATKGALISLAKSLALEFVPSKIRVNCVSPGLIQTQMADELSNSVPAESMERLHKQHPMGMGSVDDVAYSVAFLLAPPAKYITGINLVVDGGYTC